MGNESKSTTGQPGAAARKPRNDPLGEQARLPGVDHIIAVASTKGGVGKSTVAVNLALAMRDQGWQAGLLDADIFGPSVPAMLGIQEVPRFVGGDTILPVEARGLQVMSIGFLISATEPVIWRGPRVFGAVRQFLKGVQWHDLDYLVVDLPPGTGDAPLTLAQQVPLSGVVVVTTPQEIALADVRRGIQMFRSIEVPVLGVVENMSYFLCPDNGKAYNIFGSGGGQRIADEFQLPLLGQVPLEPSIREGGDQGKPAIDDPEFGSRAVFLELAQRISQLVLSPAKMAKEST
jgi:ATP-binding protein involved in chromosome partitioning